MTNRLRGTTAIKFAVVLVCFWIMLGMPVHGLRPRKALWRNISRRTHLGETLMDDFKVLVAQERQVGSAGHETARLYLENQLRQAGFTVELDAFEASTPVGTRSFTNLVAYIPPPGASGSLTSGILGAGARLTVLAAHYDSKILSGSRFVGACDSAMPCAMILHAAKTLGPSLAAAAATVTASSHLVLVFFDGEEAFEAWTDSDSIYGAKHLASLWDAAGLIPSLERFVLLDLLGTADMRLKSLQTSTAADFARLRDIHSYLLTSSLLNGSPNPFGGSSSASVADDHLPFLQRGVPVLHLISVPFPAVWHMPSDNEDAISASVSADFSTVLQCYLAERLNVTLQSNDHVSSASMDSDNIYTALY